MGQSVETVKNRCRLFYPVVEEKRDNEQSSELAPKSPKAETSSHGLSAVPAPSDLQEGVFQTHGMRMWRRRRLAFRG